MSVLAKRPASFFNPVRAAAWAAVGLILLTPLVAMQFTSAVAWGAEDFLFAGLLLVGAGLLLELILWKVRTHRTRLVLAGLIVLAVLVIWADAAVGIF
ncbi:hypothetical protein D8I30_08280 [Brevundimonas naejangsanensis]|uniref:Uncharacterized protein n=1 Tax=Brevundimonas naejangsanensis TaxID=588932 RepID=A0A494RFQ3_9CAUL|nr:hypothetical protein [Brevundimonas naejangsanensis]AYG95178.1 hypothetical protein D8I30_08280 [Brevundimonas naejangsanensis]